MPQLLPTTLFKVMYPNNVIKTYRYYASAVISILKYAQTTNMSISNIDTHNKILQLKDVTYTLKHKTSSEYIQITLKEHKQSQLSALEIENTLSLE